MRTQGLLAFRNGLLIACIMALWLAGPAQAQTPSASPQAAPQAAATGNKPNIVIIWGDDIGQSDISAYNQGMMGYKTPNIDRLAHEGALFTDYYAQQVCTAGRSAFITGQSPNSDRPHQGWTARLAPGIQKEDPTLAELFKTLGYLTVQHGKNHLGDRNEFLPTVHGFDEFYGNLYHLNAEEEPEHPDYPEDPAFRAFGPRGVMHSKATNVDDPTEDPRFGRVGKQTIVGYRPAHQEAYGNRQR